MPPRRYSRHSFSFGVTDGAGRLFLTERTPFRYRELEDTAVVIAREGDTLFGLAARAYAALPRPAGFWWVLADFQPEPIIDPTIQLAPGQLIYIPSLRVLQEDIFNPSRREEMDS